MDAHDRDFSKNGILTKNVVWPEVLIDHDELPSGHSPPGAAQPCRMASSTADSPSPVDTIPANSDAEEDADTREDSPMMSLAQSLPPSTGNVAGLIAAPLPRIASRPLAENVAWLAVAESQAKELGITKSEWWVVSKRARIDIEAFLSAASSPNSGGASSSNSA